MKGGGGMVGYKGFSLNLHEMSLAQLSGQGADNQQTEIEDIHEVMKQ